MNQQSVEERLKRVEERNKRVEADKRWETSPFRRLFIAALTYIIVASFLLITDSERPFLGALVPPIGYLLSTLAISPVKRWWLSRS